MILRILYDKFKILSAEQTIPKSKIEEGFKTMLQSEELNNVLTEEDKKLITKYLYKYYEKEIQNSEQQLLTEENADQKAILNQFIDNNKTKMKNKYLITN